MTIVKVKPNETKNLDDIVTTEEQHRYALLEAKQKQNDFEVAFCGHFSAGKSTILNTLLGAEVLPTSPIPTSANIIAIKNGELALSVANQTGKEQTWTGEIPWQRVREWGMDGNEITSMTITAPLPFLGEHSKILDTPGVDSTDDSHQTVTVEQLYTTDVIVYVMDYNHVQSETNLYFLKQLSHEKKPLFIVINQIDKHNEEELSIEAFQQSVKDVFANWEIDYLDMFYTTMKNPSHHLNQFSAFEKKLKALLYNSKDIVDISQSRLVESHFRAVEARIKEEKLEAVDEMIAEMEDQGYQSEDLSKREELQEELAVTERKPIEIEEQYQKEIGGLFKNVTLFPYTTTELTRQWLESIQPQFKVGLLFSKKKTAEERANRLQKLIADLQDKVKTQLLFHVQSYFQKVERELLTNREAFEQELDQLDYFVEADLLTSRVKTGEHSRDYVFTFTKEITAVIVKELQNRALRLLQLQTEGLESHWKTKRDALVKRLEEFKQLEAYVDAIEKKKQAFDQQIERIDDMLARLDDNGKFEQVIRATFTKSYPTTRQDSFHNVTLPTESVIDTSWEEEDSSEGVVDFSEEETKQWIEELSKTLTDYQDRQLLSHERQQLLERIDRYQKQTFIISLFGAFSAGKSSFANALLGEAILPVSPHPTTATVNTVRKSTEENQHGTAVVFVKTREQLNEEISIVAEQLDEKLTIDSLQKWKPKPNQYVSSWQKTYAEYLMTIKASLQETEWQLGNHFSVTLEQLQSLIAEEDKACLLQEVTIFYDCPVTKKGVILVDTPGVNSIHGRHTNVAFKQLRNSDAIFYLTYYNHAFSKADQYFLQQMAKVNESFSHDKLYFVINAADLASSNQELNGVRKHVYDQLTRNGIEKPRLHHVSSKQGLEAKKAASNEKTSFTEFEDSFYQHTILELKQLSMSMIKDHFDQFLKKIDDSLAFMQAETAEQHERHRELKQTVKTLNESIETLTFQHATRDVFLEQEQLLLYLRERVKFVINDYYSTAINAATIVGANKKAQQKALSNGIKEWKGLGEYFLKQEIEATLIRLEATLKNKAEAWLHEQVNHIQKQLPHLYCSQEVKVPTLTIPDVDSLLAIDTDQFLSYFKSKKDFFENGGIRALKEALVDQGYEAGSETIADIAKQLQAEVLTLCEELEKDLKQRLKVALDTELERFEAMFDQVEQQSLEAERKAYHV
ncbi:dynamin family protein [Desertibacillus haloalkaliphilus]|uniref:dynamin family protein n=1 Tax=Desertibacillus haloalkaliphilus TaxID=1328930 RepID=UPI001C278E86|nr:dynamin family protein [Desertibacillus haloalkaliphilus]MBU8907291.1 dynamin family protein [Desertibacillus haloalkaliphilus]